jgi:NADPH2:quinone reductase
MKAIRTTGNKDAPIAMSTVPLPEPQHDECLVKVHAISLNAGEIRGSRMRAAGEPIGWDFAGTVEHPAADGTGPRKGARVFGFVFSGSWAEYVAAPAVQLGIIPGGVSFEDASTLPVAGITALRTLRRGAPLPGKHVLIVPGSGGVGLFALQLANRDGARVTSVIRSASREALVRDHGASEVIVGTTADAQSSGPYDLILESLGGDSLGAALGMLAKGGEVVHFGATVGTETTFPARIFYSTGGTSLYGFYAFYEVAKDPMASDLEFLAGLVKTGQLRTKIDASETFANFIEAFSARSDRGLAGKIVVTL